MTSWPLCALSDSSFTLVDSKLGPGSARRKLYEADIDANSLKATIRSTKDRRQALAGADYVITTIKVGGSSAQRVDYEVPTQYGIDVCVGECIGPGGVFRALRTIPVMADIVRDIQEICPRAVLLNYVNPMAMVCMAIGLTSSIQFVGLCHGVQTTLDLISRYAGVKKEEIDFLAAGVSTIWLGS